MHRLDREFPRLPDQLLDQTAGLDLQLLLEGRILLQGRLELDPAGRDLDVGELHIGVQKRPHPLEKAGLARIVGKAIGDLLGEGAEYADQKIGDLDMLRQIQIFGHVRIEYFAIEIILAQDRRQPQQLGSLAGAAIAGEQIGAGAVRQIDLVSQFLDRVALGGAVQVFDIFVAAETVGDQFVLAEIDRLIKIQRVVEHPRAGAQLAHRSIRKKISHGHIGSAGPIATAFRR